MNRFVTILVISCLAFIASATDYVPTVSLRNSNIFTHNKYH